VLVSLFLIDSVGSDKLLSIDGPRLYDTFTLVQFFKLFRLLKLFKTIAIFQNFEKALVYRYDDLGILRFLLFIFFTLHWSACIFAWLDENICLQADEYSVFVDTGLEDEDRATKYIAALYWALATMTTIVRFHSYAYIVNMVVSHVCRYSFYRATEISVLNVVRLKFSR
jgi:hypothetical protein